MAFAPRVERPFEPASRVLIGVAPADQMRPQDGWDDDWLASRRIAPLLRYRPDGRTSRVQWRARWYAATFTSARWIGWTQRRFPGLKDQQLIHSLD